MNLLSLLKPVSAFILDVDGVLTDSTVWVLPDGEQMRRMNIKDGFAIQLALKKGYRVITLSGAAVSATKSRLEKLGVEQCYFGVQQKDKVIQECMDAFHLNREEVLYMGDDIPDLCAMQIVGVSACPADAVDEVKSIAQFISSFQGGMGCVRDVIEKTLKVRGDWEIDTMVASK